MYEHKVAPFNHQLKALSLVTDREAFALLLDMRTGKSKVAIDDCAIRYLAGEIDAMVILAPNGVHRSWIENQIPDHLPDSIPRVAVYWSASPNKTERASLASLQDLKAPRALFVFAMNYDALTTTKGRETLERFLRAHRCYLVADESQRIKNPSAIRTKIAIKFAKLAKVRRILTGTPATESPLDIYSQFKFLGEGLLGHSSYYSFRNRYAILKKRIIPGRKIFDEVVGYQNVDELAQIVAAHSFRVRLEDCADLPPKIYERRTVELSPNQRRLYDQLRKNFKTELEGGYLSAALALTRIMRLQQVLGGFVPMSDDPDNMMSAKIKTIDAVNPRIAVLLDTIEDLQGKVIIWARFRVEIDAIAKALRATYGSALVVEYHGCIRMLLTLFCE